ncbi:MAG: PKD domain-containing protein [Planctomycetota bacterium]
MFVSRVALLAALAASAIPLSSPAAQAVGAVTGTNISGTIDLLEIDNPNDVWSGGRMVVNGQVVIIPRNMIIQLPANWLTLQQIFDQAPPAAKAIGKSGLAKIDGPGFGGFATVLGNRTGFGNVIAGDIFIEKGREVANGMVTFINHTDGYLRIDGLVGDDTTGLMIRINDPTGRHTIQSGKGCDGGPNCSPDPRFTNDPDNYTVAFATGYPAGLPSTVPVGQRAGFQAGDNASAASNAAGVGDPFCPATNRGTNPVADSRRFAPIQVGDSIMAEGNFEEIAGERFLSSHTLSVFAGLVTRDDPTQPDYMTFAEVEWDAPGFQNQRSRLLLIGFTTLNTSQVDVFALHVDPLTNENHETPLASTVGNPDTINQGIVGGGGGIFKIRYDVDFVGNNNKPELLPCGNLANAGLDTCPGINPLLENFNHLVPLTREIQGRSTHILNPGVVTRDITGSLATNGQYLTPIGVGFPEFVEIDLANLQTPLNFDGLPWLLDRRLSPVGCDGDCGGLRQPLSPFPTPNLDPGSQAPGGRTRMLSFFPFGPGNVLPWPPAQPAQVPINPTPRPIDVIAPQPPVADFTSSSGGGVAPVTVAFTNATTGVFGAQLWSFGDGTFSVESNPVHTFTRAGAFDVSLTALGAGGTNSVTKTGFISATDPGGPNPPVANFTQNRTAGNVPLPVQFSDRSTGEVTAWQWNFGDGSFSSAQNPLHSYTTGGVFTVTLQASGPGGSNVISKLDLIVANVPGALDVDFVTNVTTGSAPLTVRFRATNVVGRALTGTFDFGDGTTGGVSANNGRITHVYGTPGTYTVTLTATDGVSTDIEQKVGFIVVQ